MKQLPLLFAATLFLGLGSCVSSRKYKDALAREQALTEQAARLSSNINELNTQVSGLNTQVANCSTRVTDLQGENARLIGQVDAAGKNAAELGRLANMTQQQLADERARLAKMQQLMEQQRQAVEDLRQKMSRALGNFKSDELTVSVRNGKVYVSLQESLLFPSGSAEVNPRGKEALGKLATALNANADIGVLIEGHTDSIPIRGRYEDNWSLSVARSTSIVRILTDTYKMDPLRVTASGRSQYEPVDTNTTAEGRARNRRTEIILAPKLDELMRLLETPAPGAAGGSTGSK
ncbi:OmpA/MotB family protein [Flaviaesturariibacter amylovorans]|uniref:OmpA family protein n=1 Tax=Flaviaesturariibacter amylovorans TaxID=1084520 RepID=A0ABP8HG72_9BACT